MSQPYLSPPPPSPQDKQSERVSESVPAEKYVPQARAITWYTWALLLLGGTFFIFLLLLQIQPSLAEKGSIRGISDLFVLGGSVICTAICGFIALQLHKARKTSTHLISVRAPIAWLFLALSAGSYSIGQIIWTGYDITYTPQQLPFPAIYDFFYLLVYPFSWIGITLLIPKAVSSAGRIRLLLDAGTAVASSIALFWYFIIGPTIENLSGPLMTKIVGMAYPLADLSLCVAAALLLFGPSGSISLRPSISRLAIGMTILALTDSLYAFLQIKQIYHTGMLQDLGWPLSWLLIGWAALVYPAGLAHLSRERTERYTTPSFLRTAFRATTPMIIAIMTCAILLIQIVYTNTAPLLEVVFVCAGLLLMPVIRQLLTLIDNLVLTQRLQTALNQSQQAFQHSQQELLHASTQAELYEELRIGIEHLQLVHARVARGDLQVRAHVEGPLLPVAHSLNLLLDRMSQWEQLVQKNQIMEKEANELRHLLDTLSEGNIDPQVSSSHSGLPTSGALLEAKRLQSRLHLRFARSRELLEQIMKRLQALANHLQKYKQSFPEHLRPEQQVLSYQQILAAFERELIPLKPLLNEFQKYQEAYKHPQEGVSPFIKPSPTP